MSPLDGYIVKTLSELSGEGGHTEDPEEGLSWRTEAVTHVKAVQYVVISLQLVTDAYLAIGLGYKFLLTLFVTLVACERTFSTLKFVNH